MTVSNQTPYVEYTANGSTTNFALTFDCDNADHLIVKIDGIEVVDTWILQGTSIVFITAPITGSVVSIERNTPLERTTNYQSYDDSFSPKPVNKDFDSIWYALQEIFLKNSKNNDKYQELINTLIAGNVDGLPAEILARIAADDQLKALIDVERLRAATSEELIKSTLTTQILNEISRAQTTEQSLQLQISTANAGIKYFSTAAEILATTPSSTDPKQAYAFDTKKNYLWNGTSWIDEGLSQLDLANQNLSKFAKDFSTGAIFSDKNGFVIAKVINSLLHFKNTLSFKDIYTTDSQLNVFDQSGFGFNLFDRLALVAKHQAILKYLAVQDNGIVSSIALNFPNWIVNDQTIYLTDKCGFALDLANNSRGSASSIAIDNVIYDDVDVTAPLMTKNLAMWSSKSMSLYVPSFFKDRQYQLKHGRAFAVLSHSSKAFETYDKLRIELPKMSEIAGTAYLYLRDLNEQTNRSRLAINLVSVADQSSKAIKVHAIGDSIVQMGAPPLIKKFLEEHGYSVQMIGTATSDSTAYNGATLSGQLGEGRGGWKASTYTNSTTSGKRPAITSVADYLALPETSSDNNNKRYYNPYLRAATGSDSTSIVRDGYVFDVADYLSKFSLAMPDVIYIGLGTNDITNTTAADFPAAFYSDMNLIVSQFIAAAPSAKIILGLPTAGSNTTRNEFWMTHYYNAYRVLMRIQNEHSNVTLCPTWVISTAESDYTFTASATDTTSGTEFGAMTDPLHPRLATRFKLYDLVSAHLAATFENQI